MPLPKEKITLEDYLRHEIAEGKTEFRITAETRPICPGVLIYIHPLGKDGESRDFIVYGGVTDDSSKFLPEQ